MLKWTNKSFHNSCECAFSPIIQVNCAEWKQVFFNDEIPHLIGKIQYDVYMDVLTMNIWRFGKLEITTMVKNPTEEKWCECFKVCQKMILFNDG